MNTNYLNRIQMILPTGMTEKDTSRVISFVVLDDLESMFDPVHQIINNYDIENEINKFIQYLYTYEPNRNRFELPYFLRIVERYRESIIADLIEKDYCSIGDGKYNIIAFALDYTRFEVRSKSYSKRLITWRENDSDDDTVHQLSNSNSDE